MKQLRVSLTPGYVWYKDFPLADPVVIKVELVEKESGRILSVVGALVKVKGDEVQVVS